MIRNLGILFAAFIMIAIIPAAPVWAIEESDFQTEPSDDPGHRGYERRMGDNIKVDWKPYVTDCKPCEALVSDYNQIMTTIFDLRWQKIAIEEMQENAEEWSRDMRAITSESNDGKYGEGMSGRVESTASLILNYKEAADEMKAQVPAIDAQIRSLEATGASLRAQIGNCEKQCKGDGGNGKTGAVGGGGTAVMPLPFDWRGPYPDVCHKCAKLAARLNELPDLARAATRRIEKAKGQKTLAELRIMEARARDAMPMEAGNDKTSTDSTRNFDRSQNALHRQTIRENEEIVRKADQEIASNERDLEEITRNFAATLDLYNKCTPTCNQQTGMAEPPRGGGCQKPAAQHALIIGPNSQYGSGAQLKDKAKGMATGMAMGALNSAIGGSGFSLGGGGGGDVGSPMGGGGSSQGPKTRKDETTGEFTRTRQDGIDLGVRLASQGDQLLVSAKIFDAPGDGTFHAMWLEDGAGNIVLPMEYFIYTLYQDWKLTVWWTHDRWVNGEHVFHDEGEEVTVGRNNLGSWIGHYEGEDGVQNSIWANHGFKNASKGIQGIGALFDTSGLKMAGDCPVTLRTYITQPDADPVTAVPLATSLSRTPAGQGGQDPLWSVIRY